MSGIWYCVGALVLSITYFYFGIRVRRDRATHRARAVLLASVVYLPVLYVLMLADSFHS
jgi:protoheme IX farnesyltransferase